MHLSEGQVASYRGRALDPAELLRVDQHMASCESCRERVSAFHPLAATVARLQESLQAEAALGNDHLPYEDLSGLIDGGLGDVEGEIARSHLEACEACANELVALRQLRPGLEAHGPASTRGLFVRSRRVTLPLAASLALLAVAAWLSTRMRLAPVEPGATTQTRATGPAATAPLPNEVPALFDAGGSIGLDAVAVRAALEWLPSREAVVEAVVSGRLSRPAALAGLSGRTGTLRGAPSGGARFALRHPVAAVSRETAPTLEWSALTGAVSYRVAVFDRDYERVATSEALMQPRWVVSPPLRRGAVYTWKVTAEGGSEVIEAPQPPEPEARFLVLDEASERELRLAESHEPRSHLVLGVLYARAGLEAEAARELRALAEANPGIPQAKALLESVAAWPSR